MRADRDRQDDTGSERSGDSKDNSDRSITRDLSFGPPSDGHTEMPGIENGNPDRPDPDEAGPSSSDGADDPLHPGDLADCPECGAMQRPLKLDEGYLCCPECLSRFGGAYDILDTRRPRGEFTDAGEQSPHGGGHGPGHRLGTPPPSTVIRGYKDSNGALVGVAWRKKGKFIVRQDDRDKAAARGTPSRRQSEALIRTALAPYPTLKEVALRHFEIGWPLTKEDDTKSRRPVSVSHPWGVPGAAAAAIYTAHEELGIEPDQPALLAMFPVGGNNPCPKPLKVLRKAVKAMHNRLGQPALWRALDRSQNVQKMLDRAIQTEPRLLGIAQLLYDQGALMAKDTEQFRDDLRSPIACLTWTLSLHFSAQRLTIDEVARLFTVSTGFHAWKGRVVLHLRSNGVEFPDVDADGGDN